jgi:DNA-binding LacI/PurR family transcriptional regulator
MRVTQLDIARNAGVSQATVSRVLAGDKRVDADKRERVLLVMKQANYQPDVRAQSLRKKRTNLVGLVLRRNEGGVKDDPFFATLLTEITEVLSETAYHLCLDMAVDDDSHSRVYDEMLRSRRVDGLILVEPRMDDVRLARLQRDNFPFVVIGNPQGKFSHSVDNDNVLAARQACLHLLEQGYRDIGFLAGPAGLAVVEDRLIGYRMALAERRHEPRVWHAEFGPVAAREAARDILSRRDRPEALIVMDDFMATGVVDFCMAHGVRIPEDLGIVSFNDSVYANFLAGGLTSINMNFPTMVREAVAKLIRMVESTETVEPSRLVVSCELKARQSSRRMQEVMR